MSPTRATHTLVWSELRSCRASTRLAASALIVVPQDHCPPEAPASPPCLLGIRSGPRIDRTLALEYRVLDASEKIHPDEEVRPHASFRWVVPEGTLAGTIH